VSTCILDSTVLRTILSEILFAEADRAEGIQYIVPKQGNWYNPQETKTGKIATWVGYAITNRNSVLKARQTPADEDAPIETNLNVITELVTVDLQFVGTKAEQLAASVMHWPTRADVADAFEIVSGQLREDKIHVVASWFKQEGMNTVYAYNVKFRLYCANIMEVGATQLNHVDIAEGHVL
jgi:hypothetical protein